MQQPTRMQQLQFIFISNDVIYKMKNDDLKKYLKYRDLAQSGRKANLTARLRKAMEDCVPVVQKKSEAPAQPELFQPGAFWKFVHPEKDPVENPTANIDFYSPTDKEKAKPDPFNYLHMFERLPFLNNVEVPLLDKYGRRTTD